MGFGSKVGGVVSHCFPLNGHARNPYCKGVEGLVSSYMDTLNKGTRVIRKSGSYFSVDSDPGRTNLLQPGSSICCG